MGCGSMISGLFGLNPTPVGAPHEGGCFEPSPLALWLAIDKTLKYTEFDWSDEQKALLKGKKIIVLCTEDQFLKCENGTFFSTGQHPVETMVPIMHFLSAGLDFDVATISGKPAVIERWSYPKDGSLKEFSDKMSDKFKNPKPISSIKADDYVALFVPGGHGSMLGLPENDKVGALMATMMKQDKFVAALCHGPAALLAAPKETFAGYKLCIFPDSVDKQSPMIGYLPGQLPWFQGEKLEQHGMELTNKTASSVTGAVHKDRQVITGDSPLACNPFGKLMVDSILESLKK